MTIKAPLSHSNIWEVKDSARETQTWTLFFQNHVCGAVSLCDYKTSTLKQNLWDEPFLISSEFYPTRGINMQNICWNMQFLSQLLMKCNIINNKA